MDSKAKICPFMSNALKYQYCIEECNFFDVYVECLIKYTLQELHNDSENIKLSIQDIVRRF